MALRNIRLYGDEILHKKAKPVRLITPGTTALLDDMLETLRARNGVGLAAPQVGVLRRIAVIELDDTVYELINPEIVETEGIQRRNEACLSVPGKSGQIDRPAYVKVKAQDRGGHSYTVEGGDLLASALCHELDHLDGVLYLDKAATVSDEDDEYDEDEADGGGAGGGKNASGGKGASAGKNADGGGSASGGEGSSGGKSASAGKNAGGGESASAGKNAGGGEGSSAGKNASGGEGSSGGKNAGGGEGREEISV